MRHLFFAADGCIVTPDATAVRGLQGIRLILTQLTAGRVQLQVASQSVHTTGSFALCNERWTFAYAREDATPFVQASVRSGYVAGRVWLWPR